jgi:hypothetical protein
MGQIILTTEMRAKLHGLTERQELRDEQGNLIGYFDPPPVPAEPAGQGGWGPFTAEEVEQAFRQTGPARTLDEILKDAGLS